MPFVWFVKIISLSSAQSSWHRLAYQVFRSEGNERFPARQQAERGGGNCEEVVLQVRGFAWSFTHLGFRLRPWEPTWPEYFSCWKNHRQLAEPVQDIPGLASAPYAHGRPWPRAVPDKCQSPAVRSHLHKGPQAPASDLQSPVWILVSLRKRTGGIQVSGRPFERDGKSAALSSAPCHSRLCLQTPHPSGKYPQNLSAEFRLALMQ